MASDRVASRKFSGSRLAGGVITYGLSLGPRPSLELAQPDAGNELEGRC
jgi:hypothetical protein